MNNACQDFKIVMQKHYCAFTNASSGFHGIKLYFSALSISTDTPIPCCYCGFKDGEVNNASASTENTNYSKYIKTA